MTTNNYLYLVSRYDTKCLPLSEWDTFDSFVVCCKTEQAAIETHPEGKMFEKDGFGSWIREEDIDLLNVTYLGIADVKTEIGIILASFNAG